MQKTFKILIKAFVCVIFVAASSVINAKDSNPSNQRIIYEYATITQKKGQSLTAALKKANLTAYQQKLIQSIPVMRAAKSDRTFRLAYAVEKGKWLLKEVRVTRGNRKANFVLVGEVGNHRFVSQKSKIPEKAVRIPIKLTSTAASKPNAKPLVAIKFAQNKGEKLSTAWRIANLSDYQKKLILAAKFNKSAVSKRQFTLYFDKSGKGKLLKGLRVERGVRLVDFIVEKKGKGYTLTNLKTVSAAKRKRTRANFGAAKVDRVNVKLVSQPSKKTVKLLSEPASKPVTIKPPVYTVSSKPSSKNKKSALDSGLFNQSKSRSQGNYQLLRMQQRKGESIDAAMSDISSLTAAQKKLIKAIPVMKKAKSTRQFNLLFEKKGGKKLLRAVNVTRGKNTADFVIVFYKGKSIWANKKGEINASTPGGFLRYPLNFSRISSHFNPRRRHPITRRIRPHRGTDFKAPHGRAVWAPADGVVTFAGRQRGYGVTLVIDHQNGYKTKYAHLSRIMKGARKGKHVRKKQIIAKVGTTGLSSGAHLHYEVIVNGRHRNPMSVALPGNSGTKTLSAGKKNADKYLPRLHKMMW